MVEALKKLLTVIEALQEIAKQHNMMLLDLYERIAKLEERNGLLESDKPGN